MHSRYTILSVSFNVNYTYDLAIARAMFYSVSCRHIFIKYVGYMQRWILHNKLGNIYVYIKSKWSQLWFCVFFILILPNATTKRKMTAFKLFFWTMPLSAIGRPNRQMTVHAISQNVWLVKMPIKCIFHNINWKYIAYSKKFKY